MFLRYVGNDLHGVTSQKITIHKLLGLHTLSGMLFKEMERCRIRRGLIMCRESERNRKQAVVALPRLCDDTAAEQLMSRRVSNLALPE